VVVCFIGGGNRTEYPEKTTSLSFKISAKTRKTNGDVWETFRNSILLLSYLVQGIVVVVIV
jgi:hypothetical protein